MFFSLRSPCRRTMEKLLPILRSDFSVPAKYFQWEKVLLISGIFGFFGTGAKSGGNIFHRGDLMNRLWAHVTFKGAL